MDCFTYFTNSWIVTEAVLKLSPLNSSDALHLNCGLSTSMWDQRGKALMREFITDLFNPFQRIQKNRKKKLLTYMVLVQSPADCVDTEIGLDLAESQHLLSLGSSVALTAVIHMTVLT